MIAFCCPTFFVVVATSTAAATATVAATEDCAINPK